MSNKEDIRNLLEKYWNCETSQEEEQILFSFFSGEDIPGEWMKYKPLFSWKKRCLQERADKKLFSPFQKPFAIRFYPMIKVAASILLVLTVGVGAYTHYQQEKLMDRIFSESETYSDPEDALRETTKVITKVSSVLGTEKEKIAPEEKTDSVKAPGIMTE